jgi:hypothetical protein
VVLSRVAGLRRVHFDRFCRCPPKCFRSAEGELPAVVVDGGYGRIRTIVSQSGLTQRIARLTCCEDVWYVSPHRGHENPDLLSDQMQQEREKWLAAGIRTQELRNAHRSARSSPAASPAEIAQCFTRLARLACGRVTTNIPWLGSVVGAFDSAKECEDTRARRRRDALKATVAAGKHLREHRTETELDFA